MKVGIIFPTYNVEATVAVALEQVGKLMAEVDSELVIIDNNSFDGTIQVLTRILGNPGPNLSRSRLIQRQRNMGYGASIKIGLDYFLKNDVTHIMVLHSDAQTDNYLLGRSLLGAEQDSGADVVFGSRFLPGSDLNGYSFFRIVANLFFNWLTKITAGRVLSDAGAAMALFKRDCLNKLDIWEMPDDWRFHPALNVALGASPGIDMREIPMRWSDSTAGSSLPTVSYGFSLFALLARIWWRRSVRRQPRWWVPATRKNRK